jgi:hypothetical protein
VSTPIKFRIVNRVTRIEEFRDEPSRTRVAVSLVNDNVGDEPAHMTLDLSVIQAAHFRNGAFVTLSHDNDLNGRPQP